MNKKKRFLTLLLVVLLCVSLAFTAIACNPIDDDDETETPKDLLISNGDFTATESENFPKTPTGWSGSTGSTGGSSATPSDSDSLISGVIDVSQKVYDKNKKKWGNLANPGKKGEDDNILMINNKVSTVYNYTLSNVSIEQAKYYKLSVWVKTVDLDKNGAFIYVLGDAYTEYKKVSTNGEWSEYVLFIEGSNAKSSSLSVKVGLGDGNITGSPSKGYAFFDNITFVEVTADDYSKATISSTSSKYSIKLPDGEFNYATGTYKPYTANKYNGVRSKDDNGIYADSDSSSVDKGIIDLSEDTYTGIESLTNLSVDSRAVGTKVLYLQNKKRTAYGYRSSSMVRFESNSFTKISILVYTSLETAGGIGSGVTLKLSTGEDKDDLNFEITDIDTQGAWTEYTFLVESNELRNRDLYVEMWLGRGGKDDTLRNTQGIALFDRLTMETIASDAYNSTTATEFVKKFSLKTQNDDIILDEKFDAQSLANWESAKPEDSTVITDGIASYTIADTSNWTIADITNPGAPSSSLENVLVMNNKSLTANQVRYKGTAIGGVNGGKFTVKPNTFYRLSMWVKTSGVLSGKGISASLQKFNKDETDAKKQWTTASSIENINSKNYTTVTDNNNKNYVELVFYVEGAAIEEGTFRLEFALGSGTSKIQADKLVEGSAFIANIRHEVVSYSEYNNASSTTVSKKYSFNSTTDNTVANGSFTGIDINTTTNNFVKSSDYTEGASIFDENGELTNAFGIPKSWTFSKTDLLENLNAGIFNTTSETLTNKLFGTNSLPNDFWTGYPGHTSASPFANQEKNILTISTKAPSNDGYLTQKTSPAICGCEHKACIDRGYCDGNCDDDTVETSNKCDCLHSQFSGEVTPLGFTSSSMTLAKASYYQISVWAKTEAGSTASITLSTSNEKEDKSFTVNTNGSWQLFTFVVETGLSDVSAKLNLFLGEKNSTSTASGRVYFDWASFSTVSEEIYKDMEADVDDISIKKIEYLEDGFNNFATGTASDKLKTPSDWKFETVDSEAPSTADDIMSGIFDRTEDDRDLLKKSDNIPLPEAVYSAVFDSTLDADGNAFDENDRVLVINNRTATVQKVTNSVSKSLAVDSYYKISIWVLTWGVRDGESAVISLNLNNKTYAFGGTDVSERKVNTSTFSGENETVGQWREYSYFIKTAPKTSISDVKLSVTLGEKDARQDGYVFLDNFRAEKLTAEEYNSAVPVTVDKDNSTDEEEVLVSEDYEKNYKFRVMFTEKDITAEPPVEEDPPKGDSSLLWLYISSGIIGGLLIIVVVILLIKKFKPKKKFKAKDLPSYNKNSSKSGDSNKKKEFKD